MNYTVKEGQTLLDITLQVYGSIDYLVKLCLENNIDINSNLEGGTILVIDDNLFALSPISNQLNLSNIFINTGGELLENTQPALAVMLEHNEEEYTNKEHN